MRIGNYLYLTFIQWFLLWQMQSRLSDSSFLKLAHAFKIISHLPNFLGENVAHMLNIEIENIRVRDICRIFFLSFASLY